MANYKVSPAYVDFHLIKNTFRFIISYKLKMKLMFNDSISLAVSDWLLITFANCLDHDQARQNVGPDLDPNCLTL